MQAIQTVNPTDLISNNFWGKFTRLPCRVHFKKPVIRDKTVQLLARQKRNPGHRTIVFAILNENDEAGGFSHACADDSMRTASEDNENVMDSRDEVVAVLSQSGSGFYQNAVDMENQGNLLDKLKAVQLHVLAMEQWNASRIKLCHRYNYYVFVTDRYYSHLILILL